ALRVTEQTVVDADEEEPERGGRVGHAGRGNDRIRRDEQHAADDRRCGRIQEEKRADHANLVEEVEVEPEAHAAGREHGKSPGQAGTRGGRTALGSPAGGGGRDGRRPRLGGARYGRRPAPPSAPQSKRRVVDGGQPCQGERGEHEPEVPDGMSYRPG